MSKNKDDETRQRQKAYNQYCRQLAKANCVPPNIVNLLKSLEERYSEVVELLLQVQEDAGIADLENDRGETFAQLAWDYASENGCMPHEELICILGTFHGKVCENN